MKMFILGCIVGIIYMGYTTEPCEPVLVPNKEACFILESVKNDTLLQMYILSPTERERTKRAKEMFDKKYKR